MEARLLSKAPLGARGFMKITRREAMKGIFSSLTVRYLLTRQAGLAFRVGIAQSERQEGIQIAQDFMQKFAAPALSVAIGQNGQIAYLGAFGVPSRDSQEQLTASHTFRIASATKPFTSVAIFKLIEDGRLKPEDKVFGRLGVLGTTYGKQPYGPEIDQITIDHLLSHTCGGWDNGVDDPMLSNLEMNQRELISWTLDNRPLKNPPGKVYAYSNFGYCLLGRVIEKLTGQQYSAHIQRAILSLCGISDMQIAGNTPRERATTEVTYYNRGWGKPYGMNIARGDSCGGWIGTPADLVKFAMHVDGVGVRRLLKPETVRRMTTPGRNPYYARGWFVDHTGRMSHGGSLPGCTAMVALTADHCSVAALTNTSVDEEDLDAALRDISARLRNERSQAAAQ